MVRSILMCCILIGATACGRSNMSGNRTLSTGPDPFGVLPSKPLVQPENYQNLPQPNMAVANRADVTPKADAARALGGRPSMAGISDQAFVNHVSRHGRDADVRDAVLERRFWNKSMALDAYAELERFRAKGVATPTAPPAR